MSGILIERKKIGAGSPPFIVAEMSGNHNQSLERALQIVEAASAAGVHALKLQTYTADTMTLNINTEHFFIEDDNSLWQGSSLYQLYLRAHTPWEWHQAIFKRCRELGIICFSTPFDETAVDFLESLNVPCYKIASFENVDLPLIRKVSKTGKPVLISTGMAGVSEIDEAVRAAREAGCRDIILLKCTSTYPGSAGDSNIVTIPHLKELFKTEVGLSDHTLGIGVAVASVALGATVIEKHFTLSRADGGADAAFSLEPGEMRSLVLESKRAWQALGKIIYGPTGKENASLQFRRSLYVTREMEAGELLTKENVRAIRPGFGLPPKYYHIVLGKRVNRNVKAGTPLSWDMFG